MPEIIVPSVFEFEYATSFCYYEPPHQITVSDHLWAQAPWNQWFHQAQVTLELPYEALRILIAWQEHSEVPTHTWFEEQDEKVIVDLWQVLSYLQLESYQEELVDWLYLEGLRRDPSLEKKVWWQWYEEWLHLPESSLEAWEKMSPQDHRWILQTLFQEEEVYYEGIEGGQPGQVHGNLLLRLAQEGRVVKTSLASYLESEYDDFWFQALDQDPQNLTLLLSWREEQGESLSSWQVARWLLEIQESFEESYLQLVDEWESHLPHWKHLLHDFWRWLEEVYPEGEVTELAMGSGSLVILDPEMMMLRFWKELNRHELRQFQASQVVTFATGNHPPSPWGWLTEDESFLWYRSLDQKQKFEMPMRVKEREMLGRRD